MTTTITTNAPFATSPSRPQSNANHWTTYEAANAVFKACIVPLAGLATIAAIVNRNPNGCTANALNKLQERISPSTCAIALASTAILPELYEAADELLVKNKTKGITLLASGIITFLALKNS
jgi:hypothetical protein